MVRFLPIFLFAFSSIIINGQSILLLDSVITTEWESGAEVITDKKTYRYDSQGRETSFSRFRSHPDLQQGLLYHQWRQDRVYIGNEVEEISFRSSNPQSTLQNHARVRESYDGQSDIFTVSFYDKWNADIEEFEPINKYVITIDNSTNRELDYYLWKDSIGAYQLSGKNEHIYDGLSEIKIINGFDSVGYFPIYRDSRIYNNTLNAMTADSWESYSEDNQAWELVLGSFTEIDEDNFEGLMKGYSYSGAIGAFWSDSSLVTYDSDWRIEDVLSYRKSSDPQSNFTFHERVEYDYYSGSIPLQTRWYDSAQGSLNPEMKIDYYYTVFTPVGVEEINNLNIEIVYPNPCPKNGIVKIKEYKTAEPLSFFITDVMGRIIGSAKNIKHEEIPLQEYSLNTGLYFLTLYNDSQRKSWKIVAE